MEDVKGFSQKKEETVPKRKPCPPDIQDWIDGYLENSKEVSYDSYYIDEITKLSEVKNVLLFRGAYTLERCEIGDIITFEYINSWSTSKEIAMDFALKEQENICSSGFDDEFPCLFELEGLVRHYIPTEYCSEGMYLDCEPEKEVGTVPFHARVLDVKEIPSEEYDIPIYHIKLVPAERS